MRSSNLGLTEGISRGFSAEETLEMFKKICEIRYFELNVKQAFDEKFIKAPIYLSVGQEAIASALSTVYKRSFIFGQHRAHDLYLAYGGDPAALIDELLHRPSGVAKGMGGSASIHSPAIGMFGHSGHMGDQIPIAVGFALGSQKNVLAVMGDASAEEDYVLGALGYAAHKKLPILFVCADNNLSILTKVAVRRNWKMADLARSFGMVSAEITDDPWLIMQTVNNFKKELPAFMNIHTVRTLWHSGTGTDGPMEWDRFDLIKKEMAILGLGEKAEAMESQAKSHMDGLWKKHLNI